MTQEEVLSPRGHVGVTLPRDLPAQQMVAYARQAEELGFDQIWVVEDLGRRGGIAQAASVLAATTGITVGIGILPAGARNVCFTGMELATLAQLHPGRLIAGIGHGMPHARLDVPGRLLARQPPDADQGVHRRAPPAPAGRARPRERPLHTLRRRRSHPPRPPTPPGPSLRSSSASAAPDHRQSRARSPTGSSCRARGPRLHHRLPAPPRHHRHPEAPGDRHLRRRSRRRRRRGRPRPRPTQPGGGASMGSLEQLPL